MTAVAQEQLCRSFHRRRFTFPNVAPGQDVICVFRRGKEWAWCLAGDSGHYVVVLDEGYSNVVRVYVHVSGALFLVGARTLHS